MTGRDGHPSRHAAFIREMRVRFGERLTLQQLIDMRRRGIDEGMLEELRLAGIRVSK